MKRFEGSVAIVTGASSGIGRRTAERLSEEGARVALFARSGDELRRLAAQNGDRMLAVPGDVTRAADIERLFAEVETKLGACTILVNNAGVILPRLVEEMTMEEWDETFAVNMRSMFAITKRALPKMKAAKRGAIVNVSSISGVLGPEKFPGFAAYCAAKAAVISFTECLAVETREHGIRVNAVSPGSVDTPMLRRANENLVPVMTPDEVATVILFLASEESRPINGQNIHVYSA